MTKEGLYRPRLMVYFGICLSVFLLLFSQHACTSQTTLTNTTLKNEPVGDQLTSPPFNVMKYGEGKEALVLLHGLGSNAKAWQKFIPLMEHAYTIYAIDLPKYLDTDDKSQVSISAYSNLLHEFLIKTRASKIHLVGHSMGGQIAVEFALGHPGLIHSLTLLSPAGFEQFSEKDRTWFSNWVTKTFYLSLSDEAIAKSFDINFYGSKLPEDAQFMLDERLALKTDSVAYSRYLDYVLHSIQSMLTETVFDQLPTIQLPTLVLFGSDDQLIPNKFLHADLIVKDILAVADHIPNAEKHLIENSGHFIQWDKPETVALHLTNFLKNNFTNE